MSTIDYSKTIFLPKTGFAMKAGLPQKEPEILAMWKKTGLRDKIAARGKGRPKFILHDGPPYANGNIHIGHALNKILKDVVCRAQRMLGHDAPYVPGWDCHGLPIEWKIEEGYRAKKKDKDQVPLLEFRKECRQFAEKWVDIQRQEFQRLGIEGDWDNPYTTMTFAAEAAIAAEIGKFLLNGSLYKGYKSVMWSVVEKTALAEAEVEYRDHTSHTVWVRFPLVTGSDPALRGASVVIWTTTPWTLPANRAIAYGADMDYALIEVTAIAEGSMARAGEKILLAEALLGDTLDKAGVTGHKILTRLKGRALKGCVAAHPLRGQGYDMDVPLLAGEFVTTEQGTGFVHIAPAHGEDDFALGQQHGIEIAQPVQGDGTYESTLPLFAGLHVFKAHEAVIAALTDYGALLARGTIVHSYPHSWRSKAPVIFRATPQWFIAMEKNDLRQKCLEEISRVQWFPARGQNRIAAMVSGRPDWCISRQRAWGVPIAVFVNKATGEPLRDPHVMQRVVDVFAQEGSDAWFSSAPSRFLGDAYNADDYESVRDIVDVWFESGSTHAFVCEARDDLRSPADLYLEGSDQHRGWFQSSLLESVGTRGVAPFRQVLTHGFILDEQAHKMSKSQGNVVAPQDVMKEYGADILRLWVVSSDYSNDLRIGAEILKTNAEIYRRLRNTLRFVLGALDGYTAKEAIQDVTAMPELEQWVLHRLAELDAVVRDSIARYDFVTLFHQVQAFATNDLSAFYFDIRKDCLYCDRPDSLKRRACRTVMNHIVQYMTRWLAPFLCFTAEDVWQHRPDTSDGIDSIHLADFLSVPAAWTNTALAEKWNRIRTLRRVVTGALEKERAAKNIGSSLESHPRIYLSAADADLLKGQDMAEICITSKAYLETSPPPADAFRLDDVAGVAVVHQPAQGKKCVRSWRILPEVGSNPRHPDLSPRDADAVEYFLSTAAPEHRALAVGE